MKKIEVVMGMEIVGVEAHSRRSVLWEEVSATVRSCQRGLASWLGHRD